MSCRQEVSAGTRLQDVSSPWDPISPGSSRRSSGVGSLVQQQHHPNPLMHQQQLQHQQQQAAASRLEALRATEGREGGATARMSPVMSHHLSKLHKKALAAGTNSSLLMQSAASSTMAGDLMSSVATGRDSVMSQSGNMDAMSSDPNARYGRHCVFLHGFSSSKN